MWYITSQGLLKCRRALVRKFPFKVFNLLEHSTVEVIAVIHARQDPQRRRGRMP
jgi:hypothetical protein